MRQIADPFVVVPPQGKRIRTSLHVTEEEHEVLWTVGSHLGRLASKDLADRCREGKGPKHLGRAERKKALTSQSTSRWAGAVTRRTADMYERELLNLKDERARLRAVVSKVESRLAAPVGGKEGRVRGYRSQSERHEKQRRLQKAKHDLTQVEARIEAGRVSVCRGSKRRARLRNNLDEAEMSEQEWRDEWESSRLFLTADGDKAYPFGNGLIAVDPGTGIVEITLPRPLADLSNTPGRQATYRFAAPARFKNKASDQWAAQAVSGSVAYEMKWNAQKRRWYLDASWKTPNDPPLDIGTLRSHRVLAVDLNADHLACHVINADGNPVGRPIRIDVSLEGTSARRDGQMRAAVSALLEAAEQHECPAVAVENLNFADSRRVGRETMGRGRHGKQFRRTVAGMPTGKFRDFLSAMAHNRGIAVVAVDPAYTSKWGAQHWKKPLNLTRRATYTGHDAAAVVIGRRFFGHSAKRKPGTPGNQAGVTGTRQRTGAHTVRHRRAAAQLTVGLQRQGSVTGGPVPTKTSQRARPAANLRNCETRRRTTGQRQPEHHTRSDARTGPNSLPGRQTPTTTN